MREVSTERGVVRRTKGLSCGAYVASRCQYREDILPMIASNVWGGIFMRDKKIYSKTKKSLMESRLNPWTLIKLSALELSNLTTVCVLAIMIALCAVLGFLAIPMLGNALQITFKFLIYALAGVMYGPIPCALLGVCDQVLVETLLKGNSVLPLFIVSFAIRGFIYGVFLYWPILARKKKTLTITRLSILKLTDTVINNIIINTYVLYHYGFINGDSFSALLTVRIGKNIVLLPIEIFLLSVFLTAMLRILPKIGMLKEIKCEKIRAKQIIIIAVIAVIGVALLLIYLFCPQFREVLNFGIR